MDQTKHPFCDKETENIWQYLQQIKFEMDSLQRTVRLQRDESLYLVLYSHSQCVVW
jgi:hypothetical protein